MKTYKRITDLIGGTPLLELTNYEKNNKLEATVLGCVYPIQSKGVN